MYIFVSEMLGVPNLDYAFAQRTLHYHGLSSFELHATIPKYAL